MGSGSREQLGGDRFGISSNIDAHFIEQMIPHHEDAVRMAELAFARAEHQEIKNLARAIQSAQNREIGEMKTWYRNWFGGEVPLASGLGFGMHGMMGGGMGMMGNAADLGELERASEFDREFIEQMIPHHRMAVMMAQMLLNATGRDEMKKLAEDIVSSQSDEIDQMRTWYEQWYAK
ncbi:DUF305 domain-containing protein [Candidatus Parcubacteria bacterium]|nr:MAG: DUF305 domain-containing protein [Candidatus Parcubacteria bacterium]